MDGLWQGSMAMVSGSDSSTLLQTVRRWYISPASFAASI